MTKVVHCTCGTDVSGETDDELVDAVKEHEKERHAGDDPLSRDQILEMAHEH